MPGYALTQDATVMCSHGGTARPVAPNIRVRIAGNPVCTQPPPYLVTGCPLTPPASPCLTASWITAATRVTIDGQPMLLQDSQATCTPNVTPLITVTTQARLRAV